MVDIKMHSVVALLEDLPKEGLVRGQVGTVVETWAPGVYEVEFSDDNGRAYAMVALKAEQLMRLHHEPTHQAADWSRNGRYLLYEEADPKTGADLWALPMEGDRKPVPVLGTPSDERDAQFSPDRKFIVYASNF